MKLTANGELKFGNVRVHIVPSIEDLGSIAAEHAAKLIEEAIALRKRARIVVATGNSQIAFIDALACQRAIAWDAVEIFHMDEYVGLPTSHPASFRRWVKEKLVDKVRPAQAHYLNGDAPDIDRELQRYSYLLSQAQIDIAFVGFGENGHIAFNDPPGADFHDLLMVKPVLLDEQSRLQQVGEGHFPNVDAVPRRALTMTCSALFSAGAWICVVPERRKARAVRDALLGPVSNACPASMVRSHPNSTVYLDTDSASLLDAAIPDTR